MSTVDAATAIEPLDECGSAVRFQSQCVVIPDSAHRSRRPRVVTKSYALPLWRRRSSSGGPPASETPSTCDENPSHLVLRVPLPTLSLKSHPTRLADHSPLPPCLVHRPQPSDPSSPSFSRHPRAPRKTYPSPSRSDIVTVPLRPCCAACQPVTDAARVDGDTWPEHFSRAASRRRSLSTDAPRTITIAGSAASASYGTLGVAISVDEIDKRRRASDSGPSTTTRDLWPDAHRDECGVPAIYTSLPNVFANSPPSPSRMAAAPTTPRIPEEEDDEDESELFPLPSPKRTPSVSPAPSIAGSISSLVVHQHQSSGTSPVPSTCSGESALPAHRRFLAPPPCGSSSSLSLPVLPGSTPDLSVEDPPRVPSPSLLSTLPTISARNRSPLPVSVDATSLGVPHDTEPSPAIQEPHAISPRHSPRLPWRARRPVGSPYPQAPTPEASPPSSGPHAKKSSFSMSSPLQIFSDVLRGVSAMGSGAGGLTGL